MQAMRGRLTHVLLGVFALQAVGNAVCKLPQPRHVCQEYFAESVVVVAKVARMRHAEAIHPGSPDGTYYYMEAVERVRGRILNRFQIYEENSSGRATFEWKRGESYLLFISYSNDDKGWELDGCGNSAPMSNAKKVLDEIARIKAGKGRESIEGSIASEESLPERVLVKVEGAGKTHTVAVENREFKVRMEPGSFVATPLSTGWRFEKDDFSYDDPRRIRLASGQCAQIQFQATKVK